MALTRTQLSNFYADRKPYLVEVIGQDFKEHPGLFNQFLNVKSITTGWKDTATVSGFGLFSSKVELEDAASDDILQGPTARTAVVTYAKRNMVSQEAIEDEVADGIIASRLPEMMKAGRATQEVLAHYLLNSGFTAVTTPDGAYLFSDSHTNLSGGTFDNKLTADPSESSLDEARLKLHTMTDDRGLPIVQMVSKIVCPPALTSTFRRLLETEGVVGSAYNDINLVKGMATLIESPYLTSDSAWFTFADGHKLNFIWRIQPENWSDVNYQKSGVEIGMRFRCAVEALDARSVIGSDGSA